jgi:hypothetical protein
MVVTLPIKNPYFADIQECEPDSETSQPATDEDDDDNSEAEEEGEEVEERSGSGGGGEVEGEADQNQNGGDNRGRSAKSPVRDKKKEKKRKKKDKEKNKKEKKGKEKEGGHEHKEKRPKSLIKRFGGGRESEGNVSTKTRGNGDASPAQSKKWRLSLASPAKVRQGQVRALISARPLVSLPL